MGILNDFGVTFVACCIVHRLSRIHNCQYQQFVDIGLVASSSRKVNLFSDALPLYYPGPSESGIEQNPAEVVVVRMPPWPKYAGHRASFPTLASPMPLSRA